MGAQRIPLMRPATLNPEDTHRDLVEGCLRGDRQAQFALYRQYARAMYNICLRMLRHEQDAEDVLQLAFTDVFRRMDSFRFESSIGAWIKRIVVNNCINHLNRKRPFIEPFEARHAEGAVEPKALATTKEPNYDVQTVKEAVKELPDGYRVVLTLYLFEGYDHEEIASILGVSVSTSKSQYSRARRKLQQLITADN